MFSHYELPEQFYQNEGRIRECLVQLALTKGESMLSMVPNKPTPAGALPSASVGRVVDGIIKVYAGSKLLYFLETGDIFLTMAARDMEGKLISEFPSVIEWHSLESLARHVSGDQEKVRALIQVHHTLASQLHILLHAASPEELDIHPETRTFAAGDVLIVQETTPTDVFTLLSGEADVFVQDRKVGEVKAGEIFGAMAATGAIPRSASVIARTPCVVLALARENFLALARTHPATLYKLIDTMSRVICDLNERLVAGSASSD